MVVVLCIKQLNRNLSTERGRLRVHTVCAYLHMYYLCMCTYVRMYGKALKNNSASCATRYNHPYLLHCCHIMSSALLGGWENDDGEIELFQDSLEVMYSSLRLYTLN